MISIERLNALLASAKEASNYLQHPELMDEMRADVVVTAMQLFDAIVATENELRAQRYIWLRNEWQETASASGHGDFIESASWLRTHRAEYAGRWVALAGGMLVDCDASRLLLQRRISEREDLRSLLIVRVEGDGS